ncbi:MAG: hypothetical protein ABIJ74_04040 [archaeon]
MSTNIIAYSFPLTKISKILKSQEKEKISKIFFALSRGLIDDSKLKKELEWRLKQCIEKDVFNLEKFWLYLHYKGKMGELSSLKSFEHIKVSKEEENTKGITSDTKWSKLAVKEFSKENLKYSIFNFWESSGSSEREAYMALFEKMKETGCKYFFSEIGENNQKEIIKRSVDDFRVVNSDGYWLLGITKIKNFSEFSENVKKEWGKKIMKKEMLSEKEKIKAPLLMIKNALLGDEDAIQEILG